MSDSENESVEEELKIVLLGDSCTGKTSIIKRYCNNDFSRQYFPTLGVDFFLKRMVLLKNKTINLKIWDVGGTSHSGSMLDKYIFGSNIIILVYDVTNENSFHNVKIWFEIIKNLLKHQEKKPMFAIFGNKCDLEHQRMIRIEKHQKLAGDLNFPAYIISARTGECVNLSFQKVTAEHLGVRLTKSEIEELQPVVKAEISTYSDYSTQPVRNLHSPSRSSVCSIQ